MTKIPILRRLYIAWRVLLGQQILTIEHHHKTGKINITGPAAPLVKKEE